MDNVAAYQLVVYGVSAMSIIALLVAIMSLLSSIRQKKLQATHTIPCLQVDTNLLKTNLHLIPSPQGILLEPQLNIAARDTHQNELTAIKTDQPARAS